MKKTFNGRVNIDENDEGYYAIIDHNGKPISDYYSEIEYVTDSLAKVYDDDKELYALMNANGQIISDWYDDIEEFDDEVYKLTKDDDEQIYNICTNTLSSKYYQIEGFVDGLYKAIKSQKDDSEALLSKKGEQVSDWFYQIEEYDDTSYFEVTNHENHDLIALINHEGQLVTDWVEDEDDLEISESLSRTTHTSTTHIESADADTSINNNINIQKQTKMGLFDQLKNAGSAMLFGEQSQQNAVQQRPQQSAQQPVNNQSSTSGLYNPQMEKLIDLALADGELTEKEKQVLFKKAESMGIDLDEFEMVLDARLYEHSQKEQNSSQSQAAPQSNKFGDVKKCPSCGAMIQSFTTKCPDCGYEFRNVEANNSIQHLFELLNNVTANSREDAGGLISGLGRAYGDMFASSFGGNKETRQKKAIIQNFPIPNTKEDIIEFLTLALPLAKKPGLFEQDMEKKEMYPVWKAKCEQIIMKARFSMKDDPKTLAEINEYGKQIGIK